MICALGDRFGGYALFACEGRLYFSFARAADLLELSAPLPSAPGRHFVEVTYGLGAGEDPGRMALALNEAQADVIEVNGTLPLALQHGGTGLRLAHDAGFAVSARYTPPAPFSGVVHHVTISTPAAITADPADEVRAALHGD